MHARAPAVFLDRDDTLLDTTRATRDTDAPGDLIDPALATLLPGAPDACAALAGAGFTLVVVTNQGAVGAGRATLRDVERVNDRLRELLAEGARGAGAGDEIVRALARVAVYAAPSRPSDPRGPAHLNTLALEWRKPAGGMVLAAAAELGLDLNRSWAIGDASRDVEAAVAGGVARERALRVMKPGEGGGRADAAEAGGDRGDDARVFAGVREAAAWVLRS